MTNQLILQGRLVADIEVKQTNSGTAFCEFTVAWSEKIKEIENKCFMRCKAWGTTATFLGNYFSKGQELVIEGQMRTEEWEKDGQKQSRTICNINKVHFCGSKGSGQGSAPKPTATDDFMNIPDGIEELPFN